jgi:hypothetical protein
MRGQLNTEVRRLHAREDRDQHRMLSMIERMHREGRSEHEIVAALGDTGARAPITRRSRSTRPVRGRLARWAARRRA